VTGDRLDLVKEFNKHWPHGYTIELRPDNLGMVVILMMPNDRRDIYVIKPADGTDNMGAKLTVEDALCFVDKAKNLCDFETYGQFLDVMTAFKAKESVLTLI